MQSAADLGCGPGDLTRVLAERWPAASVVGVDNSAEMLEKAQAHALPGMLRFEQGDLSTWQPDGPLDLVVSNAALHSRPVMVEPQSAGEAAMDDCR